MNYRYKSSKSIIAKVFRDLGVQDSDWISDAVEWIGEAMEHIGSYSNSVPKIKIVYVENFKTELPTDMYILDSIRYSTVESDDAPKAEQFNYILSKMGSEHFPSLFGAENSNVNPQTHGYMINGNFINTSFQENWIAISYRAFNLDDDGYPMVPDMAEFSEALFWYITMKLLLRGLRHPVVQYGDAEQRWLKYAGQARNSSNMPDKEDYRNFREKWVQMVPKYDYDIVSLYENVKQPSDFINE